jgi:hypothetical protein
MDANAGLGLSLANLLILESRFREFRLVMAALMALPLGLCGENCALLDFELKRIF